MQKFGFRRTIVFETLDEELAYSTEAKLVSFYKTYAHGGEGWWGANLDLGGRGGLGTPKSLSHRQKLSAIGKTKTGSLNNFFGRNHSPETIQIISESMKGENGPCFGRCGKKHPMFGKRHTEQAREKMRKAHQKPLTELQRQRNLEGHQKRKKRKEERDQQIITLLLEGLTNKEVAERLNLHLNLIYGARSRLKHFLVD